MFFLLLGHLSSQNIHLTIKSLGTPEGADLGRGWGKQNTRSLKRVVNIMAKIKANSPDRYLITDFYFVALLVFLVKPFSLRFQFSNCNTLGTCPIDSAAPRYQPHPP